MWVEDAIFMERNSRTFQTRIAKIDENTEALCDYLREHPKGGSTTEIKLNRMFTCLGIDTFLVLLAYSQGSVLSQIHNYGQLLNTQGGGRRFRRLVLGLVQERQIRRSAIL